MPPIILVTKILILLAPFIMLRAVLITWCATAYRGKQPTRRRERNGLYIEQTEVYVKQMKAQ